MVILVIARLRAQSLGVEFCESCQLDWRSIRKFCGKDQLAPNRFYRPFECGKGQVCPLFDSENLLLIYSESFCHFNLSNATGLMPLAHGHFLYDQRFRFLVRFWGRW